MKTLVFAFLLLVSFSIQAACQNLLVPAYFYPDLWNGQDSLWNQVIADAPLPRGQKRILIMNPDSGVGSSQDQNYVDAVAAAQQVGVQVIGYISTQWSTRPILEVKAEIDLYVEWYGVDGVFLDEMATAAGELPYYFSLIKYYTWKYVGKNVVLNPGIYPDKAFFLIQPAYPGTSKIIFVTTETAYPDYESITPPTWSFDIPDWRQAHLIHDTAPKELEQVIALTCSRNAKWIYVTDDVLPNPWDTLPSYWENLRDSG